MPAPDEVTSPIVTLSQPNGLAITLGPALPKTVDGYEFIDFWMSIESDGLLARTLVRTIEGGTGPYSLTQFVQELADDWKGERSRRDFESIEHHFSIAASRDPLGHVLLRFTHRESYLADSWEVRATAEVDAGEGMSAFARCVHELFAGA